METNDKRSKRIVQTIVFLAYGSFIFYFYFYHNYMLKKYGVYTIATYNKTTAGGRQGSSDEYFFYCRGEKIYKQFKTIRSSIHKYFYCYYVPSKPNISKVLYDLDVPYCYTPDMVLKEGWKVIPKDTCSGNIPPVITDKVREK